MKKIICIILAAVLLFAAGVGAGVFLFRYRNNNPKTPEVSGETVKVSYSETLMADSIFKDINKYKDRWGNALKNNYGMPEDKVNSVLEEPENWLIFNLFLDVTNTNDYRILIGNVEVENNGKNGIYFQTKLDGTTVIDPNATAQIYLYVFFDDNEPSLEEATEMIKDFTLYVNYITMPEDIEAEIPDNDFSKVKVSF